MGVVDSNPPVMTDAPQDKDGKGSTELGALVNHNASVKKFSTRKKNNIKCSDAAQNQGAKHRSHPSAQQSPNICHSANSTILLFP